MRRGFVIAGLCIVILILTAGCTSPQSTAAAFPKTRVSGAGPAVTGTPVPGFLSPAAASGVCFPSADMRQYKPFFPDMANYTRAYKDISGSDYRDVNLNSIEEIYTGSKFFIYLRIYDYTGCDSDLTGVLKNIKAGDTENNLTVSSVTTVDYHGFPSTRIEITNTGGEPGAVIRSVDISPKITVLVIVLYTPALYPLPITGTGQSVAESDFNAEIDRFLNAMDFNGISTKGTAMHTISKPISLTARYNNDGTITVTSNGGPAVADISVIRISVNKGKLRDNLDPQAGSAVTVQGTPGSKNHIIAVGTFRNGTYQVVFETDVGPNP